MNKTSSSAKEIGLVSAFIWFLFEFIFWCLVGWCIALFISFALLFSRGYQSAMSYNNYLLQGQLIYLGNIPHTLFVKAPLSLAVNVSHQIYEWLLVKTHLLNTVHNMHAQRMNDLASVNNLFRSSYPMLVTVGQLCLTTTKLIAIRLVIIVLSLPTFVLMGILGFIDGLVLRELRRYSGGRESALIYHRSKSWIKPSLLISCVLYLILPLNLPPDIVLLPFALSFGYLISITTKMFKKYI